MVGRLERLTLRRVTAFSRGIYGIPHLGTLLGAEEFVPRQQVKADPGALDAVVGWGFKATATRARAFAARHGIRYVALEDGFLRSAGSSALKPPPISIVLDDMGIYYEARLPSRLERLIGASNGDPGLLETGREVRRRMVAMKLTKYNTVSTSTVEQLLTRRRRVLVVDQTFNDQAVIGAGAGTATFERMLFVALQHYAARDIVIKAHPDVVAGRSRGYLDRLAAEHGIDLVADNANPFSLMEWVDEVWTVSSGLGFEALLAGLRVRCFGAPFYAGWGLTDDSQIGSNARAWLRRRAGVGPRDVDHLAAASLVAYPRYADPVRFEPLHVYSAMDRLAEWRDCAHSTRSYVGFGMSRQKRQIAKSLFGAGPGSLRFAEGAEAVELAVADQASLLVWADRMPRQIEEMATRRGVGVTRMAPGVIRADALGTPMVPLASIVVDDIGLYFDATRASGLEDIIARGEFGSLLKARAAVLGRRLVALGGEADRGAAAQRQDILERAAGRRIVVVVGDPAHSPALKLGSSGVASNGELLAAVRAADPQAFLLFLEPPELAAHRRGGWLPVRALRGRADFVVREGNIARILDVGDEVHVMTSPLGFDALVRGLRVVCWGVPFFAGWGLTDDRVPVPRRVRRLTLDELVAAVLILYPRYIDPISRIPCRPEDIVARLEAVDLLRGLRVERPSLVRRLKRRLVRLEASVRHAVFGGS